MVGMKCFRSDYAGEIDNKSLEADQSGGLVALRLHKRTGVEPQSAWLVIWNTASLEKTHVRPYT
jgi:hypothetical protein